MLIGSGSQIECEVGYYAKDYDKKQHFSIAFCEALAWVNTILGDEKV